ncbi:MAG: sigma-70 family RNA polymerase sigma factor, partial [Clostridia bacterium]|nr:sigma-70 family RNA polymerase sigma factor [Clostridia bacterium]
MPLHFITSLLSHFFCFILGVGGEQNFPPPLKASEERALFERKMKGDREARNKLIEHNLRLVAHIVRKYYLSHPAGDELISIGSLGLIKAVDSFDPRNGARFATYAAKCIQNEILMYFRSQKKFSMEVSMHETIDVDKDGNPLTYMDVIATEDNVAEEADLRIKGLYLRRLVSTVLGERERQIITLRYGLDGGEPQT